MGPGPVSVSFHLLKEHGHYKANGGLELKQLSCCVGRESSTTRTLSMLSTNEKTFQVRLYDQTGSVTGPLCKPGSAFGLELIILPMPPGPTSSISTITNGRKAHVCVFSTSDEWSQEGYLGQS